MNILTERQHPGTLGLAARSLCTNCSHAPTCGHRARHQGAVWFCEDFEIGPVPAEPVDQPRPAAVAVGVEGGEIGTTRFGLCSNCENRASCRLPEPEGGVWFCEEYR